jgi:hypothetical protein
LLIGKAVKAMNFLNYHIREFDLTLKVQCQLVDSFVTSILSYAAEVWGNSKDKEIERVQ